MANIMYNPRDVGREVINGRGNKSTIRKYHMTEKEQNVARKKWNKEISGVHKSYITQAGPKFFNPYRRGIYYYQIYSMFLLGANKWHSLGDIIAKMEDIMTNIIVSRDGVRMTAWDRFKSKKSREASLKSKDFVGRIQENMIFFQRLNKLHPTGYKLMQTCSAVDMKRISKAGFPNGCFEYRLSTYDSMEKALPIRDFREFNFPRYASKYVSYKFVGTIITQNKVISKGVVNEMS